MIINKRFIQLEALDINGNVFMKKIYDMRINFIATSDGIKYFKDGYFILRPYWITRNDVDVMYKLGSGYIEIIPYDIYSIRYIIKKSKKRLKFS